jgi:predicted Zn-ribbon and HTH transcriptional regulator
MEIKIKCKCCGYVLRLDKIPRYCPKCWKALDIEDIENEEFLSNSDYEFLY